MTAVMRQDALAIKTPSHSLTQENALDGVFMATDEEYAKPVFISTDKGGEQVSLTRRRRSRLRCRRHTLGKLGRTRRSPGPTQRRIVQQRVRGHCVLKSEAALVGAAPYGIPVVKVFATYGLEKTSPLNAQFQN